MFSKARLRFDDIFENRIEADTVREYLIDLYNRGETSDEIAAAATAMREHITGHLKLLRYVMGESYLKILKVADS